MSFDQSNFDSAISQWCCI